MATERGDNLKIFQDLLESQCPSDGEQAATVEGRERPWMICGPGTRAFPHAGSLPNFVASTTCRLGHELSLDRTSNV
jgi:hypothetical protein